MTVVRYPVRQPNEALVPFLRFAGMVLAVLALAGCATLAPGTGGVLRDQIDAVILEPPLDQVNWGIRIVDPERGRILYSRHAHLKFVPASNMKILSAAAAVQLLGPDFRYETRLLGVGTVSATGDSLRGDLLLQASGDPTFSERFYPSAEAPLDSLANQLWASGIRVVDGTLVVDASTWDSTSVPGTWEVDDLTAAFASTGGPFAIAEGVQTLEVTGSDRAGLPAQVRWWPYLAEESIEVDYQTVEPDTTRPDRHVGYLPESRRLQVSGTIHVAEVDTLRISQRDPVRFGSQALLHALERRGIEVAGGMRVAWDRQEAVGPNAGSEGCTTGGDCPGGRVLASIASPRMAEIIQGLLEPSQNWITEQVVRTLGAQLGEEGSWSEGFRLEREFFQDEVGVDSLDLILRDGSGISAKSLVTPRAIIRILDYMRDSPNAGIWRNALASPGEEESTLRSRLTSLESRVFAKTGTITHVNSLSGYVFTDSGRELIFSILTNGSGLPSRTVRRGIDRILEATARH